MTSGSTTLRVHACTYLEVKIVVSPPAPASVALNHPHSEPLGAGGTAEAGSSLDSQGTGEETTGAQKVVFDRATGLRKGLKGFDPGYVVYVSFRDES